MNRGLKPYTVLLDAYQKNVKTNRMLLLFANVEPILRKAGITIDKITNLIHIAWNSPIIKLVILAVVMDTFFGCVRAIKEHGFNSSFGIDGAIRKVSMLASVSFLLILDRIVSLNLIGFLPESMRAYMPMQSIGVSEFFGLLYLSYELVSILKNMTLCGLPVKSLWLHIKNILTRYTDELPDNK